MSCLDDAMVLGLVEGRLAPDLIARVDEHIDSCASCRDVVTLVASSRSAGRVLARGDNVGRYVIGDLLGAGAMGRVYSAWEPELDRRVAIKVLHDEASRDRLVKEAQAMARLNHPNVVTVHEVGSTDGGVFVAMELVDGETLRAWATKPRTWREVVRVLVEVTRGLAAVHAAGVVHRDIKPDNVIVGTDGRVRLGDFGLARSGAATPDGAPSPSSFALGTLSGGTAVAGTPAYMAPEVLRGGAADAASDQFSFGVMAYELLAGKRPFEGSTWADLLRSIENHGVRALSDVPGWLDDVVQRCIAVEPAARYPSLAAVADTLTERAARRSPLVWLGGALAAVLLASGITWAIVREPTTASREHLEPGWDAGARAALVDRGVPPPTLSAIDRWNAAWLAERDHAERTARNDNLDRVAARERCLVQRRDELQAILRVGGSSSERLLDAVAALPDPGECRNADADPLPADPTRAERARDVLRDLPAFRAQIALGGSSSKAALAASPGSRDPHAPSVADAMDTMSSVLVRAATDSGHAPTLADALLARAEALRSVDALDRAADAARDAVAAAERGHADLLRARAWLARVAIAGEHRDLATAEDLGAVAHAAIDRIGAPHLAAQLARLRGLIAYNRGRLEEARTFLLASREQFIALGRGDDSVRSKPLADKLAEVERAIESREAERTLDIASVDSALGSVARAAGDLDEAERRHASALRVDRNLRGGNHRDVARDLHNLAGVYRLRGDLVLALDFYQSALAVEVATQGERSIAAALTHNSIGLVELARDDLTAAATDFTIARDILTAANHGDRAFAEHNLGLVAQARGDHEAALAHFDAASKIYATTIGADAPAAVRLVDDRAASEQAIRAAKPLVKASAPRVAVEPVSAPLAAPTSVSASKSPAPPPKPPTASKSPAPSPKSPAKKDVGVYGSAQSW